MNREGGRGGARAGRRGKGPGLQHLPPDPSTPGASTPQGRHEGAPADQDRTPGYRSTRHAARFHAVRGLAGSAVRIAAAGTVRRGLGAAGVHESPSGRASAACRPRSARLSAGARSAGLSAGARSAGFPAGARSAGLAAGPGATCRPGVAPAVGWLARGIVLGASREQPSPDNDQQPGEKTRLHPAILPCVAARRRVSTRRPPGGRGALPAPGSPGSGIAVTWRPQQRRPHGPEDRSPAR